HLKPVFEMSFTVRTTWASAFPASGAMTAVWIPWEPLTFFVGSTPTYAGRHGKPVVVATPTVVTTVPPLPVPGSLATIEFAPMAPFAHWPAKPLVPVSVL